MVNTLKHPNAKTCNFQILELFISSTCALIPNIDSNICFIIFTQYIMKVAGVQNKNDKAREFFSQQKNLSISGVATIVVEATSTASDRVSSWS
jgi:hypothetical protein